MNSNKKDKENTQFIEFFDELLEFFEEFDKENILNDIILLGENGAIRRIGIVNDKLIKEDDIEQLRYLG